MSNNPYLYNQISFNMRQVKADMKNKNMIKIKYGLWYGTKNTIKT